MVKKRGASKVNKRRKSRKMTRKIYRQKGGVFEGITYISQGAEGATFRTSDNRLLKISKTIRGLEQEIDIHRKLVSLGLPYFPAFYETGQCITREPIDFNGNSLRTRPSICDAADLGPYTYPYILMEYVDGGKEFPKYLSDNIRSLRPALDSELNAEEVLNLVNDILSIFGHLCFAFYVADKVFNYRHMDFNDRNCLIKPDGTPVIIDFGGNRMLNNNTAARNINTREGNLVNYRKDCLKVGSYSPYSVEIQPYVTQIRNHPKMARFLAYTPTSNKSIQIQKVATLLESLRSDEPEKVFNYEITFSNLGIPQNLITLGAQKIQNRVVIVPQVASINSQIGALSQFGYPENMMRLAVLAHPGNYERQVNWLITHTE